MSGSGERLGFFERIFGSKRLRKLVEDLRHPDAEVRLEAAKNLKSLGWKPKRGEEEALLAVAAQDWAACRALGTDAMGHLLAVARDPAVREQAVDTILSLGDAAFGWIEGQLHRVCAHLRILEEGTLAFGSDLGERALVALAALEQEAIEMEETVALLGERVAPTLLKLLSDRAAGPYAGRALARMGCEAARQPVRRAFRHHLREHLDKTRPRINDPVALVRLRLEPPTILSTRVAEHFWRLRTLEALAEALGLLSDRDAGPDLARLISEDPLRKALSCEELAGLLRRLFVSEDKSGQALGAFVEEVSRRHTRMLLAAVRALVEVGYPAVAELSDLRCWADCLLDHSLFGFRRMHDRLYELSVAIHGAIDALGRADGSASES